MTPTAGAGVARATHDALTLLLVIGAGVVSAFQVGKAPVALQSMQADLGVDLGSISWVLSAFALVGAVASFPVGVVSDRLRARRAVIVGLLLQAAGSALGATAATLPLLLATRTLEGLGFLAVTVAAPAMVRAASSPARRARAFAAWATFMPLGMAIVMLNAPAVQAMSWRGLWWANAALLVACAVALAIGTRRLAEPAVHRVQADAWRRVLHATLRSGGAWFLGGQFCAYSAVYFALFGFLPTLLTERLAISSDMAGILSAVAVGAGVAGCLACGILMQRGHRAAQLLAAGFWAIALCSIGILLVPLPGAAAYGLCLLFSFAGAFIPVVIFDAAGRLAARPSMMGAVVGLANQGNNAGMVIGPVTAGAIAGSAGWSWVGPPIAVIALLAGACAVANRHRLEGTA